MKSFFKTLLASFIGIFIALFIGIFLLLSVIGTMTASMDTVPVVPKSAILKIDSSFSLSEQNNDGSFNIQSMVGGNMAAAPSKSIGILNAVKAIEKAATDPAIKMIYINTNDIMVDLSYLEEFRNALLKFKESGKAIVAYGETYTQSGYYLSSVADKVYVNPFGGNMMFGVSTSIQFFKGALDKFGVDVQLIRHGKYKSAGEQFVNTNISDANREQYQAMVSSLWKTISSDICVSRGIDEKKFNNLVDNLSATTPEQMLQENLVDGILSRDEMTEELVGLFGVKKEDDLKMITLDKYAKAVIKPNYKAKDKIAIIYADGQIYQGEGSNGLTSDRYSKIISDVKKDTTIKAVLLRVNSPGGDAIAAEIIRKELELLQEKKPVVVSYGAYAASGGYWISAQGDKIFSNEATLTGSIGVFSLIPNCERIFKDKLRINTVTIKSNKHAGLLTTLTTPLDKEEIAYMQQNVEIVYDAFLNIVAEGRDMKVEHVDNIAQGRVWSGSDGLKVGLVDEIGGIADALLYTENISGLSDYQLVEYPKPQTNMEKLTQMLGQTSSAIESIDNPKIGIEKAMKMIKDEQKVVYARMENDLIF